MSKGKLACTLPWREIEGEANKKTRTKCSRLCACFQALTAIKKKKTTNDFHRLSRFLLQGVDFSYKLSNKFIEDFERIMDFVEYKHIKFHPS